MYVPLMNRRRTDDALQRRQYAQYLATRLGPATHALMLVAVFAYVAAVGASAMASASSISLCLRLAPIPPLLLVAVIGWRVQRPLPLSLLILVCVALLEVGINVNGLGRAEGLSWVLPGCLLVPVASSVIWPGRWDFIAAMVLCALGPLPMLLLGPFENAQLLQYAVYMTIALCVSMVLHAFTTRMLLEQFRLEQQLREQAYTDDLTGLFLRNHFLERARRALIQSHRRKLPVCLLYLDVDHFKEINDGHGHAVGDTVLVALAALLRAHMRGPDLIGRIGGEEFAMLLPGLELAEAWSVAERLRLAAHDVPRPDGPLTVSIGVAECTHSDNGIESLLARADQAMRRAKRSGRDRVASALE
jgi:diguanylate cyclase (GGDEF)-like protein